MPLVVVPGLCEELWRYRRIQPQPTAEKVGYSRKQFSRATRTVIFSRPEHVRHCLRWPDSNTKDTILIKECLGSLLRAIYYGSELTLRPHTLIAQAKHNPSALTSRLVATPLDLGNPVKQQGLQSWVDLPQEREGLTQLLRRFIGMERGTHSPAPQRIGL